MLISCDPVSLFLQAVVESGGEGNRKYLGWGGVLLSVLCSPSGCAAQLTSPHCVWSHIFLSRWAVNSSRATMSHSTTIFL